MLQADGTLKAVQDTSIEVFSSWIKWAVMSRILPEWSSEFWFFLTEASASQLPRVLFFKIFGFQHFFDHFFDILFFGSFSIFRHRILCPEDKQLKKLFILWYGVATSSFFPKFSFFYIFFDPKIDMFLQCCISLITFLDSGRLVFPSTFS